MKALVTGGNGFIGSHLAEELQRRGHHVVCLVRASSDLRWIAPSGVELVFGDVRDAGSLAAAVSRVDWIFHLGAVIRAGSWKTYFDANVTGTYNLLQACLRYNPKLRRFVFVSSIAAAGPAVPGRLKNEDDPRTPVSDYGRSKLLAEDLVMRFADRFPVVILRPPNVLGPREKAVVMLFQILDRRLFPLLGNGDKQSSFCYVEDITEALILAAEHTRAAGRTYFITDGCVYSWREPLDMVSGLLGKSRPRLPLPYPLLWGIAAMSEAAAVILRSKPPLTRQDVHSMRARYWTFDGSRLMAELGFRPRFTLEDGLRRTVEWYRKEISGAELVPTASPAPSNGENETRP